MSSTTSASAIQTSCWDRRFRRQTSTTRLWRPRCSAASAERPSRRKPARRFACRSTISTISEVRSTGAEPAAMAVDALLGVLVSRGGTSVETGVPAVSEMRDGARIIQHVPGRVNEMPSRRYYLYMMLPAIIVLACITIYPFFWLIWMSLHDVDVGAAADKWNSFRNWTRLPDDSKFINGWVLLIK